MERAASLTGGTFGSISDLSEINENVKNSLKDVEASKKKNICKNMKYNFGQENLNPQGTISEKSKTAFPVSIQSEDLKAPARLQIEYRDSELGRLVGSLNRIIDQGKETNEVVSEALRVDISARINFVNDFDRVKYPLSNYTISSGGSDQFKVSDKLIIGFNGEEKFSQKPGGGDDLIDLSNKKFQSYRGAAIQHIAVNTNESTGMKLDELQLKCTSCSPQSSQKIANAVDLSKGSPRYDERGGLGAFSYSSQEIEIGENETEEVPAVCIEGSGERSCNVLNVSSISETNLKPGNYILTVEYDPAEKKMVIDY
jgi:hypothetical protein